MKKTLVCMVICLLPMFAFGGKVKPTPEPTWTTDEIHEMETVIAKSAEAVATCEAANREVKAQLLRRGCNPTAPF